MCEFAVFLAILLIFSFLIGDKERGQSTIRREPNWLGLFLLDAFIIGDPDHPANGNQEGYDPEFDSPDFIEDRDWSDG
jgi:hypothetical protein